MHSSCNGPSQALPGHGRSAPGHGRLSQFQVCVDRTNPATLMAHILARAPRNIVCLRNRVCHACSAEAAEEVGPQVAPKTQCRNQNHASAKSFPSHGFHPAMSVLLRSLRFFKGLADLFKPPKDLSFKASFDQAKEHASEQNKWMIANIQVEFCLILLLPFLYVHSFLIHVALRLRICSFTFRIIARSSIRCSALNC